MKLVKKIRLVFKEGNSDKVYEVDLVEVAGSSSNRYLVNFRYGRRGRTLNEGTKTVQPVELPEAEKLYDSIVVSKTNKGYHDEADPVPPRVVTPTPPKSAGTQSDARAARNAALLEALADESDSKKRARHIWNLGQSEVEGGAVAVVAYANRGDWREDYSIAWTLGRWRDNAHVATLEKLQRHSDNKVKEIAFEALLLAVAPSRVATLLETEKAELPPPVRAAIESNVEASIASALNTSIAENASSVNRTLITCYRLALINPMMHRALLSIFKRCELRPGTFKAVRRVFKVAEMRIDYEMFACLAHRFDTTKEYFRNQWGHAYIPGQGSMRVDKELARDNPRLAYSDSTRQYLRRRAWRTMRRLGRIDSNHYIPLAKAVLLQANDSDAVEPRSREVYRWSNEGRRSQRQTVATKEYGPFANLTVFNHVLHGGDKAYELNRANSAWSRTGNTDSLRGERFTHLWDRDPNAALDLLKLSHCAAVHDAAIGILQSHQDFLHGLSPNEIAVLLNAPYLQTSQFALPLAQACFKRGQGDDHLLLALLKSNLEAAREFGASVLSSLPDIIKNRSLLIELLLIFGPPVPNIVARLLSNATFDESEQQEIASSVITQLLSREIALSADAAETLAQLLVQRFPIATKQFALTLIDRLLSQSDLGRQLLGARLLVANSVGFKEVPDRLLQHIHGSQHEQVRAIAVALLNKQSIDDLAQQADMLAELYYRGAAAERRELLGVFSRLSSSSAANQERVLHALLALLFRAEHDQGQADELHAFFTQHLMEGARTLDKDTLWRLLQAQSAIAQRVGTALLVSRTPTEFSVRQWAKLAHHADVSARQYAITAFEANEGLIKSQTRDALRLLDSSWDNVREFGFRYFRDRYQEADWSPEYIVGICDSTESDVQNFGRELLQRFFREQQGPHYLAALSEHPSINVQLFVTNFLEEHASGHSDRVLNLRGFFVTVLSHINKARICKDRVLQFLLREALRDVAVAQMAAEIFTRLSLTAVRKDRSQLIKAMIALQAAFPQLSLPIKTRPLRATYAEATSGV